MDNYFEKRLRDNRVLFIVVFGIVAAAFILSIVIFPPVAWQRYITDG